MNVIQWAISIFTSNELSAKLLDSNLITDFTFEKRIVDLSSPGRSREISFSTAKVKFPKVSSFIEKSNRARAIAFFANHELEAIEMMCAALIKFGGLVSEDDFSKISRGIVSSIKDEQKHLKMYLDRLQELGSEIKNHDLNDFFWKQFENIKNFDGFFSLMSLTFEAANLDFCLFYEKVFNDVGDFKSSEIMRDVFYDEVNHVRLGAYWLNKWRENDSLWNYYLNHLPAKISPERSKGIEFSVEPRIMSGLDDNFIKSLLSYKDEFNIPKRRTNSNESIQD
jgi:uncharacterized ferritin-like protein (DUF455 family)